VVLEGVPHGSTHNYLGGHMRSFISPADPIFFSHHAYIDKLWAVWQDCHQFATPAVKAILLAEPDNRAHHKYYAPTQGHPGDNVDDPMVFSWRHGNKKAGSTGQCKGPTGDKCEKTDAACAECVHGRDSWCASNTWDPTCCAMCTDMKCQSVCGASQGTEANMHSSGSDVLKDWINAESTPAHVHSTHEMEVGADGTSRSYSYAFDEVEKSLMEIAPEVLGSCHADALKVTSSFLSTEVVEETQRLHHTGTHRGHAARAYAEMVAKAFEETRPKLKKTSGFDEQHFTNAMKVAQEAECKGMASKCDGDYKKEFNCKADQARFFLPWMGSDTWNDVMANDDLKHAVLQDPCCAGDEESLVPGPVP